MFSKPRSLIILLTLIVLLANLSLANKKQESIEYLAETRKDIQFSAVKIAVKTPKRDGRNTTTHSSGVVIFQTKTKEENIFQEDVKYNRVYILTTPHVVSNENWDLKNYKKNNVKIFVIGRDGSRVRAEIVAWAWGVGSMLIKADFSKDQLKNYKFKPAEIAKKLPIAQEDASWLNKNVQSIFLGGYPGGLPVVSEGHISKYAEDYLFKDYCWLIKIAFVNVKGFNGPGQSGGGAFNSEKELIGIDFGGPNNPAPNIAIIIPIDVIAEKFLKFIPELDKADFPKFKSSKFIRNFSIKIERPK